MSDMKPGSCAFSPDSSKSEVMLYAFDLLELDGEDPRPLPLADRKLARLLGRRRIGIVFSEHTDEDGALLFVHACLMGLETSCRSGLARPIGWARRGTGSM
jgi:ATP-dependent DNA ligase